jgi:hypothetical protein
MPLLFLLAFLAGVLSACSNDSGYIELRSLPAQQTKFATLSVGSVKLSQFTQTPLLLRLTSGTHNLTGEGFWTHNYCSLEVRKNRITTTTVIFDGTNVRCQCLVHSRASTAQRPVCA